MSGHVTGTDSYLASAQREIQEEIGVEPPELRYLGKVLAYTDSGGQLCGGPSAVFVGLLDVDASALTRQETEVADVAWFAIQDVRAALTNDHEWVYQGDHIEFAEDFRPVFELFLDRQSVQGK